ncbi:molybdopterin cofactor-binding domain-containing protein [Kaarinaea lacus]
MSDSNFNKSRRSFLKSSLAGGGLVIAAQISGCDHTESGKALVRNLAIEDGTSPADPTFMPNVWLRIAVDSTVNIQVASSEMGQGIMTALTMLIAEELDADWQTIQVTFAPAHQAFANPKHRRQLTGGSESIRGYWQPLRHAGASAKAMLIEAAAQTWQVDKSECFAEQGVISHKPSGKKLRYGELAATAATLPIPKNVPLKQRDQFRIIGTPRARLDVPVKTNGQAVFGIDVQLPNLLSACIARCPVFGGELKQFNAERTKKIKGVIDVVAIDGAVAVIAKHFWAAWQGRNALEIEWHEGDFSNASSQQIHQHYSEQLQQAKTVRDSGDADVAIEQSDNSIEAFYQAPYLAHACMEPINCTAYVQTDRCDVWVPTQAQSSTHSTAADVCGLGKEQVFIHTTYLGGGFGRRGEVDFVRDAVQLSKHMKAPVKVIWTREDDMQHDFYRPYAVNKLSAALDEQGWPVAWRHDIASASILKRFIPLAGILLRGVDPTATEGAANLPYAIPNVKVTYAMVETNVPVGFWRAVGNSQNGYITECFIDEIAALGKKDPLTLRRRLLKEYPRHLQVLDLAAEKAQWQQPLPAGVTRGIAVVKSFDSYVANVVEIRIDSASGAIDVLRVVAGVDCGVVVNPNTVVAQIESAVIFGLTAALYGEITIDNGRVQQNNFHDYELLRIQHSPQIEVHLVESDEAPGGVGEIGVPPIAPALANAVFAATGKPIRRLPIRLS